MSCIEPYWRNQVPFTVTARVRDPAGEVTSVELWYRYSADNSSWGDNQLFGIDNDNADGWSWEFTAPEGDGYYEFYSIAVDVAGNREEAPSVADARAGVDRVAPVSRVFPFEGDAYWKRSKNLGSDSFTASAVAVDDFSRVEGVELWYRHSLDNWTDAVAWKKSGWQPYTAGYSLQPAAPPLEDDFLGTSLDQAKWENWQDGAKISWVETTPPSTDITLKTRTSDGVAWSEWSAPCTNPAGDAIASRPGQYIQYKATLSTTNENLTPE